MRRLYELEDIDPQQSAPIMELSDLRSARIAIMLEEANCTDSSGSSLGLKFFIESLTPEEETDIIHGLIAHHHGIDVAYAVDLQAALRDLVKKDSRWSREELLEEHDRQTMDLSLIQRVSPEAAERQSFLDSVMQLERHYDQEHARTKLQASFHGMTLG